MTTAENQMIKASFCQSCNGWVRAAGLDYLTQNTKARNEFSKEVMKHNLSVREMPVDEWRKITTIFCSCK